MISLFVYLVCFCNCPKINCHRAGTYFNGQNKLLFENAYIRFLLTYKIIRFVWFRLSLFVCLCFCNCPKINCHRAVTGAGRSSEVERSLMVRWVVGSILHRVDPLSYFSFQPVLHDWCNKGRGMCYPVWDGAYKRTLAVNR